MKKNKHIPQVIIPPDALYSSPAGCLKAFRGIRFKRNDRVRIERGTRIVPVISHRQIGFSIVTKKSPEVRPQDMMEGELFYFADDDFRHYLVPGNGLILGDDKNESCLHSVLEFILVHVLKARFFTRQVEGKKHMVEVVLEFVPFGANQSVEHVCDRLFDLGQWASFTR